MASSSAKAAAAPVSTSNPKAKGKSKPKAEMLPLDVDRQEALRQLERVKGKLTKDVQQAAAAEPKTTTKEKDTVNVEESGEEENPADSRQCRELARASEEDSEAAKDDSRAAGVSKPILSNLGVFQHNEESRASGVSEPILNILGSCYRTQITNYDQIMGLCSKYIQEGKFDHHALENVVMSLSGNQVANFGSRRQSGANGPLRWKDLPTGVRVPGHAQDIYTNPVTFSPKQYHGALDWTDWTGDRGSVNAFTARPTAIDPEIRRQLRRHRFQLPFPDKAFVADHEDCPSSEEEKESEFEEHLNSQDCKAILEPVQDANLALDEVFNIYPAPPLISVAQVCQPWLEPLVLEEKLLDQGVSSIKLSLNRDATSATAATPTLAIYFKTGRSCGRDVMINESEIMWQEENDVMAVDATPLNTLTTQELNKLMEVAHQLHRKFGHPSNRLLIKNLRARNADSKVYHFVLMVGEASGYAVIREAFRLPEDEHQNLQYLPGDLVYFRRLQHPADLPANNVVDRPRVTNWKMAERLVAEATSAVSEYAMDYDVGSDEELIPDRDMKKRGRPDERDLEEDQWDPDRLLQDVEHLPDLRKPLIPTSSNVAFMSEAEFLQARSPDRVHPLYGQLLPELAERMGIAEGQSCLGSAYGLTSAPREWYIDLTSAIKKYGGKKCHTDPCLWRLYSDDGNALVGIIGIFVDDLLFAGDEEAPEYSRFLQSMYDHSLIVESASLKMRMLDSSGSQRVQPRAVADAFVLEVMIDQ
eukprot:s1070_g14.t1